MKKIICVFIGFWVVLRIFPAPVRAETEIAEARIVNIVEEKPYRPEGSSVTQLYQKLELFITAGPGSGQTVTAESGNLPLANTPNYRVGDEVVLTRASGPTGDTEYFITDYQRRGPIVKLFFLFAVLVITIARWRGILSLVGMALSFLVIFRLILPRILDGADPVRTAILGSLIIIPVTFFLSHGLNRKTGVAVAGTLISLVFTGFLAKAAVSAARLTGFAAEEAGFLEAYNRGAINMQGLLLAGIIIGVLGVLDDITVSQSSIVFALKKANRDLNFRELFRRAMSVGQDHIASMVNTLILVYTGASLPLLLLFINNPQPYTTVINHEIIADEIIRTLVGSIGLVLAVPVTTILAAASVKIREKN